MHDNKSQQLHPQIHHFRLIARVDLSLDSEWTNSQCSDALTIKSTSLGTTVNLSGSGTPEKIDCMIAIRSNDS
jgi:hypothetical protein